MMEMVVPHPREHFPANASRRDPIVPVTPIANLGSDLPWMVDREAVLVLKRMLR